MVCVLSHDRDAVEVVSFTDRLGQTPVFSSLDVRLQAVSLTCHFNRTDGAWRPICPAFPVSVMVWPPGGDTCDQLHCLPLFGTPAQLPPDSPPARGSESPLDLGRVLQDAVTRAVDGVPLAELAVLYRAMHNHFCGSPPAIVYSGNGSGKGLSAERGGGREGGGKGEGCLSADLFPAGSRARGSSSNPPCPPPAPAPAPL